MANDELFKEAKADIEKQRREKALQKMKRMIHDLENFKQNVLRLEKEIAEFDYEKFELDYPEF